MILLFPLLFAFFYRCRGGYLSLGARRTQIARIFWWGVPNAIVGMFAASMLDAPLYAGFLCGVLAWAVSTIKHGLWMGVDTVHDVEMMMHLGALHAFAVLLPLTFFHPWLFFLFPVGALSGLCYLAGKYLEGRRLFDIATDRAEWGELLSGAVFGFLWVLIFGII